MRLILLLLIILPIVRSAVIDVSVADYINVDIIGFRQENFGEALKVSFEAFNSGSVGCNALFRVDVEGKDYSFRGWSRNPKFQPSDRKQVEFYLFFFNKTGNFTGKIRYYCANEIKEVKNFSLQSDKYVSQPTIEIISPKFFRNKITLHVRSNNTGKFAIIPVDYPRGWIVEQKTVYINSRWPKYVEIEYFPDIWMNGKMKFVVVGENGGYGIREVDLRKENIFNEFIFYALKILRK
ncbi:MAG: hypothetical protein QXO84_03210 [Candidatus Aenigmatarchaeota archaeon]